MNRLCSTLIFLTLAVLSGNAIGKEVYLNCYLKGPEDVSREYTFAFDPEESNLFWVQGTQKLEVIRNTSTQLWATHETKFRDFAYDATDFRLNRVTGAAEINYLKKPSSSKVEKCKKERDWGCESLMVLTDKAEHGACNVTGRAIE